MTPDASLPPADVQRPTTPPPLTEEELAEIEARANAAAAGPWRVDGHPGDECRIEGGNLAGHDGMVIYDEGGHGPEDALFIAHARSDVPRLIADLRASRAEVERLREELEEAYQRIYDLSNGS